MTKDEYLKEFRSASFNAFTAVNEYLISGDEQKGVDMINLAGTLCMLCGDMQNSGLFSLEEFKQINGELWKEEGRPEKTIHDMRQRLNFIDLTFASLSQARS